MMHELGTNAAKYGSLSNATGAVHVTWVTDEEGAVPALRLEWEERGGPPVSPPARLGFGTRLIERALSGTLGSKVAVAYEPLGVRCVFTTPLRSFSERE